MVEHRARDRGVFGLARTGAGGRWGTGAGERLGAWLKPRRWSPEDGRDWRLPVVVTVIWLTAVGAYAVGYFQRLGSAAADGAVRALPTLDLLFFAFAAVGPLAMLWMIVLLQARAARLSDALAAQSESALALAATVANLHEAVDALSAGTTERLADASARMERDSEAGFARLDEAAGRLSERLDTTLLDCVVALDRGMRERAARSMQAIEAQREGWTGRLDADADRLARILEASAESLGSAQAELSRRMTEDFERYGLWFEKRTSGLIDSLRERVVAVGKGIDDALDSVTGTMVEAQRARLGELDADLRQRENRMHAAVDAAARTVEGEVAPLLAELRFILGEIRDGIAANPPASADELARLLGDAAGEQIAPDRAALAAAVERIADLEEKGRLLLERIDRTARLASSIAPPATANAATPAECTPAELPFPTLPRAAGRAALDWTAVVGALDGGPAGDATRHAIERARADPDVAAVIDLGAHLAEALAEDGLHIADLAPLHSPASLWHRFARGERGGEIAALAGIEDVIALAIARTRLREDDAFRALALRFVEAYARLVGRAGAELGPDRRLVEMAETPPGRVFALLAGTVGALRPVAAPAG